MKSGGVSYYSIYSIYTAIIIIAVYITAIITQDGELKFSPSIVRGTAESLIVYAEISIRWPINRGKNTESGSKDLPK